MRHLLPILALLPFTLPAQTLEYAWLNQPCAQVLNCDSGCTACNVPGSDGAALIGTNMAKVGVDVCPHPVSIADNALFTYGWPAIPDEQHKLLFSGLTLQPLHIDSVIIRHHKGTDGPELLRIGLSINNAPSATVCETMVPDAFGTTVLTDLGVVADAEGGAMGLFQFTVQAMQGQGGSWVLDDVRIVTSPAVLTGVEDLTLGRAVRAPRYDLLGRPAPQGDVDGVFIDRFKRLRVR